MLHHLVTLVEKMLDYIIVHVGKNDAIDYESQKEAET